MDTYVLTAAQFHALATGHGSTEAIELLVESQAARRRLLLLAAAERAAGRPEPGATSVLAAIDLVCRVERDAPSAARAVFGHPFIEAWFAGLDQPAAWRRDPGGYLAALASSAAALGRLRFTVRVRSRMSAFVLPGLGTATGVGVGEVDLIGAGEELTVRGPAGKLAVPYPFEAETPRWKPLRRVAVSVDGHQLSLAIDDADPYRDRYPPNRPMPHLPGEVVERWHADLAESIRLLAREQPDHWYGLTVALHTIVPILAPGTGNQLSATARDAFGAMGLSTPSDVELLGELLVHELQHLKLGAVLDLVDLCRTDDTPYLHAPWRPDPRPAGAVLQGVYAFVGVTGYWRTRARNTAGAAARRAAFQFAYWRCQCRYALRQLLDRGALTEPGRIFCAALAGTLDGWSMEPVPTGAQAAARLSAVANRVAWRLVHQTPDPVEVAAVTRAWQSGGQPPRLARRPANEHNPGAPPTRLSRVARQAWEAPETGVRGADAGERALLRGDPARAAEHFEATLVTSDDWAGLCTALAVGRLDGSRVAYHRPDLLRSVAARLGAAPARARRLASWLDDGGTGG